MKKSSLLLVLIITLISCNSNSQKALKRYQIKSGIVEYKSTITGNALGSTMSGAGTETIYFKDWGAIELKDERSTQNTTIKILGTEKNETEETHIVNKLDNGEWYTVNFDRKEITAQRSIPMDMITAFHPDADAGDVGRDMIKGLEGKMIGEEDYKGYKCEIWEAMGVKQWVYKHFTLKIESTVMGITTSKEATSIQFDIPVPDKYFELPDFPIVKTESFFNNEDFNEDMDMETDMESINEDMTKLSKLSFEEWKTMALADKNDEEMQNMSEAELREMYNMIQKMIKMRNGE
ncbi:hypothetical protein [Aequorivita sp. CIP111184]|uniref:hypothetical protein n=1 Tax=Aequorivita sp. CIP111184 TaxID=2211356 RepID=UPI000DBBF84D|nr:hypothetical protein [Aequorivita sp. CIP111184]SRX54880.1 hypothetical protein AEQU1_01900 [Aequorivita sp. CIP111184]